MIRSAQFRTCSGPFRLIYPAGGCKAAPAKFPIQHRSLPCSISPTKAACAKADSTERVRIALKACLRSPVAEFQAKKHEEVEARPLRDYGCRASESGTTMQPMPTPNHA